MSHHQIEEVTRDYFCFSRHFIVVIFDRHEVLLIEISPKYLPLEVPRISRPHCRTIPRNVEYLLASLSSSRLSPL